MELLELGYITYFTSSVVGNFGFVDCIFRYVTYVHYANRFSFRKLLIWIRISLSKMWYKMLCLSRLGTKSSLSFFPFGKMTLKFILLQCIFSY